MILRLRQTSLVAKLAPAKTTRLPAFAFQLDQTLHLFGQSLLLKMHSLQTLGTLLLCERVATVGLADLGE